MIKLLEPIHADSRGGSVFVEVKDTDPKPRRYRFTWTFDQDVTNAYLNHPFGVTLSITGDGPANASGLNPYIRPKAETNGRGGIDDNESRQRVYMKGGVNPLGGCDPKRAFPVVGAVGNVLAGIVERC